MLRFSVFGLVLALNLLTVIVAATLFPLALWLLVILLPITAIGVTDIVQTEHSILRNYPLIGHLRWAFEGIRPEIRQYFVEADEEAVPFSREQRSIVYQRAKNELDKRPFGTELDVYEDGYAWLNHSAAPTPPADADLRVTIGNAQCSRPYQASVFNISAMSFGSLGANAVRALNQGAKLGGFAHDTGEGGISRYHREPGGDLIWEIGSGYFGCRDDNGRFDRDRFAENAGDDQVKMIEVKLSQGAKPGHGGVLPAAKITPEIAAARGVPMDRDCISPSRHSAFDTPIEMAEFLQTLRELSGGKPVGFKLCIGHRWEFLAIVKAILETQIVPDFIVVDGSEGGTGAAPIEFTNHVGTPLTDGLTFVRNALISADLRDQIRVGASGKAITAFDLVQLTALGADWCNSARGFMFALGCIQAQKCHTNHCPAGVTTQDPLRQRALVVADKAQRVASFHRNTLVALSETIAAAGFRHPQEIAPEHLFMRMPDGAVVASNVAYPLPNPGALRDGSADAQLASAWAKASPTQFAPVG